MHGWAEKTGFSFTWIVTPQHPKNQMANKTFSNSFNLFNKNNKWNCENERYANEGIKYNNKISERRSRQMCRILYEIMLTKAIPSIRN